MLETREKNVIPIDHWQASTNIFYFSVACKSDNNHLIFGRTFVRYDKNSGEYVCECHRLKGIKGCVHLIVAKVFMNQILSNEHVNEHLDEGSTSKIEVDSYKLKNAEAEYILSNKAYPCELPEDSIKIMIDKLKAIRHLQPRVSQMPFLC